MSDSDPHHQMLISTKAVLHQNGRVLLVRNARDEWDLPGGKLHKGEELAHCLERELTEELGFSVAADRVVDAFRHHFYENILVIVYACPCSVELEASPSDEHSDSRWCDVAELPTSLPEHYRQVAIAVVNPRELTGPDTERTDGS